MLIRRETSVDFDAVRRLHEAAFGDPRIPVLGKRAFTAATALGFRAPSARIPEPAFQVATMPPYEPWMTGALVYSAPFWDHDCVGLR